PFASLLGSYWGRRIRGAVAAGALAPALLRELDRALLADHRHLDLARVLELFLDVARDLVGEQLRLVVVDLLGLHDHTDLAPGLERIDAIDALPLRRQLLERLEALDVRLEALAARAWSRRRDRVRGDQQHRLDRLRLHFVVVRLDRVHDGGRLAV